MGGRQDLARGPWFRIFSAGLPIDKGVCPGDPETHGHRTKSQKGPEHSHGNRAKRSGRRTQVLGSTWRTRTALVIIHGHRAVESFQASTLLPPVEFSLFKISLVNLGGLMSQPHLPVCALLKKSQFGMNHRKHCAYSLSFVQFFTSPFRSRSLFPLS